MRASRLTREEVLALAERLRPLAARGLSARQAAAEVGCKRHQALHASEVAGFSFAPPPLPRAHFERAGRRSAASPRHHHFSDEERQRSARTRQGRGEHPPPVVDWTARRLELVERALDRVRAS